MATYSKSSLDKLNTCDARLIQLFSEVIKYVDCKILEGNRTLERQRKLYEAGKSKTMNSKHLSYPSQAVDVVPYPIDWQDLKRFYHFTGFVRGVASQMDINIRCGADWNGDFHWKDQNFHDLPHFELIGD